MGNCIATNKLVSENDEIKQQQQLQTSLSMTKKVSYAEQDEEEEEEEGGGGKRRMVRFKLSEDQIKVDKNGQEGSGGKGAVRIRVVLTKEELRQILKHRKDFKCNSLEKLVSTLRLRERRIHETCSSDHIGGSWKPALESISEDN